MSLKSKPLCTPRGHDRAQPLCAALLCLLSHCCTLLLRRSFSTPLCSALLCSAFNCARCCAVQRQSKATENRVEHSTAQHSLLLPLRVVSVSVNSHFPAAVLLASSFRLSSVSNCSRCCAVLYCASGDKSVIVSV